MPIPSYTKQLFAVTNASGPFPMALPFPSVGTVWVIRDVCFYFPSGSGWFPLTGQASLTVAGNQVAATPAFATLANTLYETRDIRQTVEGFTPVQLHANAPGWNLEVTGYAFTS